MIFCGGRKSSTLRHRTPQRLTPVVVSYELSCIVWIWSLYDDIEFKSCDFKTSCEPLKTEVRGSSSSFYCNHIDAVECIYVIECDCWCDTVEAWHLCEWWSLPFRTFYIKAHPPTYTTWLEVATLNSTVLGTYVLRVFVETSSVYFCTYRQAMWVYSVYIHHSGESKCISVLLHHHDFMPLCVEELQREQVLML